MIVTRAPGRLDVMGGIADYSGALVLQLPIAEATWVALTVLDRPVIEIFSPGRTPCAVPLETLQRYADARQRFAASKENHWAAYVAGVFTALMEESGIRFHRGAKIAITSKVPAGKGVSSSAALETATMQAVVTAFNISIGAHEMALLCQKAENLVAGAPCGVMDQMACVFGEANALMALLCQPAELQPPVAIPEDLHFWGLDSGERHAVTGSDYRAVRTGAFMGLRIVTAAGRELNGYLANLPPDEFERDFAERLPVEMSGQEFLDRYAGTVDTVTTVEPGRIYKVRKPAAHPVYEHRRVRAFRELLQIAPAEERRVELGRLMYESHASYSACGLGSRGTDLLVDLARTEGPSQGIYGARITGGGSGGTVAILGRRDAGPAIRRIAAAYERETGHRPYIFSGSSEGVARFGALRFHD